MTIDISRRALTSQLDTALRALLERPESGASGDERQLTRMLFGNIGDEGPPGRKLLLETVAAVPEIVQQMQIGQPVARGESVPMYPAHFAAWLLQRAAKVGRERSLEEFWQQCDRDFTPYHRVLALAGIRVEAPIELPDGIELISWKDVPDSATKRQLETRPSWLPLGTIPDCALISKGQVKKYPTTDELEEAQNRTVNDVHRLFVAAACISLTGPIGFERIVEYAEGDDDIPLFVGGIMQFQASTPRRIFGLLDASVELLRDLFPKLAAVELETRSQLMQIAFRISGMLSQSGDRVEQWMKFGIALEALYLKDNESTEMIYRLRLRAARFHDATVDERLAIMKQVGKAYDYRSKAVHRGKVDIPRGKKAEYDACVLQVSNVMTAACRKILQRGSFPDWDRLLLGET